MSKKHISIAIILIVLIIILSELHTSRTNQQIQNDRYEAEERLKNLFKDPFSDDSTTDPKNCLLYTSPSPRDRTRSRMPSSA